MAKGRSENNHSNLLLTHNARGAELDKPNLLKFLVAKGGYVRYTSSPFAKMKSGPKGKQHIHSLPFGY